MCVTRAREERREEREQERERREKRARAVGTHGLPTRSRVSDLASCVTDAAISLEARCASRIEASNASRLGHFLVRKPIDRQRTREIRSVVRSETHRPARLSTDGRYVRMFDRLARFGRDLTGRYGQGR